MNQSTHLQALILSSIDVSDMGYETPCWISNRAAQPNGYTKIGINERTWLTHRAAYEAWLGPIPEGLQLDHLCRNRACCRPGHLEPVTCLENLLRGESFAAKYAAMTHCKQGHELAGDNLYIRPDGRGRGCQACRRIATGLSNERRRIGRLKRVA